MLSVTESTQLLIKNYSHFIHDFGGEELLLKWHTHKVRHSYEVLSAMQRIIIKDDFLSSLDERMRKYLEVVALLHDIARFHQQNGDKIIPNNQYEHGDEGYNILKKEGINDPYILLSIKYHNKFDFSGLTEEPEWQKLNEKEREELMIIAKAVKDADKVQNMEYMIFANHSFAKYDKKVYENYGKVAKNTITKEILEEFRTKQLVSFTHMKTQLDRELNLLSWMFDINYQGSKDILKFFGYKDFSLKKMEDLGINEEQLEEIKDIMKDY